jgi:hypothetical protein
MQISRGAGCEARDDHALAAGRRFLSRWPQLAARLPGRQVASATAESGWQIASESDMGMIVGAIIMKA